MASLLEKEFAYYLKNQKQFVKQYNGKVLLIKNCTVIGVYNSDQEAIEETTKQHELGTFLVQLCEPGVGRSTPEWSFNEDAQSMKTCKKPLPRAFTISNNKGLLNVLMTPVQITAVFNSSKTLANKQPSFKTFRAIWDTGAGRSCISQKVVDQCGLKPTGMICIHHLGGEEKAEVYHVNIGLLNEITFANVKATKLREITWDAVIGMDIINCGDFAVTNTEGKTVFSFRIPSIQHIDFAEA